MDGRSLEKNRILIYGAGGNGISLYQRMSASVDVLGFIDKRAKKLRYRYKMPLFDLQEISTRLSPLERAETIVVITVKNVFIHSDIAGELLKAGFSFLLYKPLNVLKNRGSETENLISELYESIIERAECNFKVLIPRTDVIQFKFVDKLLISRSAVHTTAWVPVELIFNYRETRAYPGLNMPLFFPLVELYRAFLSNTEVSLTEAIDNYCLYCGEWLHEKGEKLTVDRQESFLESRQSVFSEMQKMAEVDIDFFKANAPLAERSENKFFLKSSGRNRVAFLIAKGFKYVPLRMSREDYEDWCNIEMVHAVEQSLSAEDRAFFFAPYPHPYFADYPVQFADYQRLFLEPIANEITKTLHLNHVLREENPAHIDFAAAAEEKSRTHFFLQMDDDGLSKSYFSSIGFHVNTKSSELTGKNYLLIDSRLCCNIQNLLDGHEFDAVYCLQWGAKDECVGVFGAYGYHLKKKLFESVCREGCIRGLSFQKG